MEIRHDHGPRDRGVRHGAVPLSLLAAMLTGVSQPPAYAGEPVIPFPGAGPEDLIRGLPATAFAPRSNPDRAFMESYSAWLQLDDGTTLLANLPITNLPSPHQCSVAIDLYQPDGREVLAEAQFSEKDLKVTGDSVSCGGNALIQSSPGRYRWTATLPRADGHGDLQVDWTLSARIPPFKRGDGRVHLGDDGYFEMLLLVPGGSVTGHYRLDGVAHAVHGQAYLDYAAQSLWAHELATFWLSYRFFSRDLYVASTTFVTSPGYDSRTIHHVTVSLDGAEKMVFATSRHRLDLDDRRRDDWSGYDIPGRIVSVIQDMGVTIALDFETRDHLLSKTYILAPLNPLVRAVISTFIARPYTYRYRAPVDARVTDSAGSTRIVPGTMVVEMIFVNRP